MTCLLESYLMFLVYYVNCIICMSKNFLENWNAGLHKFKCSCDKYYCMSGVKTKL